MVNQQTGPATKLFSKSPNPDKPYFCLDNITAIYYTPNSIEADFQFAAESCYSEFSIGLT